MRKAALTVDAQGLSCPFPVKKAEEGIKKIRAGEVLEIITTDPGSKIDIPAWAEKNGHRVVEVLDRWLEIHFYVEKGYVDEKE
ncbi:MAG: sulfurtransferase TusA family protein [Nitrososphaerales archaeon]